MIPPGGQAFAQPRRSSLASPRSPARSVLASSLALVLAFATIGCESKSSTSTGPSPVKCQVSLEAPANTIDPGGGKDAITVSTQPECSWTASSGASWISGLTPASGQGSGRIEFQASANPAGTMRQGDIAVNDQHVPVQQRPATCRYEVTPATQTVAAGGGTVTIAVNTLAGCSWQASVEAGWIAITATSGTGSGDVSLRVDPNGGGTRSAALLVAGQTVTADPVLQHACVTELCVHARPLERGCGCRWRRDHGCCQRRSGLFADGHERGAVDDGRRGRNRYGKRFGDI